MLIQNNSLGLAFAGLLVPVLFNLASLQDTTSIS
jgi:hypothetical protein